MKKLMIAAAIVCAAAFAQASAFSWSMSTMAKAMVAGSGSDKTLWNGQAYLFCAETYSQKALLDATKGDGIDYTKAVADASVVKGVLSVPQDEGDPLTSKTFNYGSDGQNHNFYLVLVEDDMVYVGANTLAAGQEGKTTPFSTKGTNSNLAAKDWEKGSTFTTAGWYNTVPEPTSGLLLLLGVAGLALRRRRA